MDKETLSNYGWIVIAVLILVVMIVFATPFGNFIAAGFKSAYIGFTSTNNYAIDKGLTSVGAVSTPKITIDQDLSVKAESPSVADSTILISGVVEDKFDIKTLTVNGQSVTLDEDNGWSINIEVPRNEVLEIKVVATNAIDKSAELQRYVLNTQWSNFTITQENRHKIGYTGEENEVLVIPETFFDEEDKMWYRVTTISDYAFEKCENLKEVVIPNSVKTMWTYVFSECINLEKVILPNNIPTIQSYVFYKCEKLCDIKIPQSVTSIEACAFRYCYALENIEIPNSVTKIEVAAFSQCTGLKEIIIPDNVTDLANNVFYECKSLEKVIMGDGVTQLNRHTFSECHNLKYIKLSKNLEYIGQTAFKNDYALKEIIIPDAVTIIYNNAFNNCTALSSVKLGAGLVEMQEYAFYNCSALKSITIPRSVEIIGQSSFRNTGLTEIKFESPENWYVYDYAKAEWINYFENANNSVDVLKLITEYSYMKGFYKQV